MVRTVDDGKLPRPLIVETVREVIAEWETGMDVATEARARLERLFDALPRRVINATGVILHTNLGRAPWSPETLAAASEMSEGYGNIELDLVSGERGRRNQAVERLAVALTGAEATLVVNNNAAGVFLVLIALAVGRPVPVSRGELIEIGGSYRLPELMKAAGVDLVEVGTTNRTRIDDYAAVSDPALLFKVHPSNYRVVGFSAETGLEELSELAARRQVPLVYDVGSGLVDERVPWLPGPPPPWLEGEPGVRQAIERGADLVLFSGDKLLGGPQAGVIAGRRDLVASLARHPVARALRVDGATAAALSATLMAYLDGRAAGLPVWRMAAIPGSDIEKRARSLAAEIGAGDIVAGSSTLGAGSAPGAEIATVLVSLPHGDHLHSRLLRNDPAILARRVAGALVVDLRTVDPADDVVLAAALSRR